MAMPCEDAALLRHARPASDMDEERRREPTMASDQAPHTQRSPSSDGEDADPRASVERRARPASTTSLLRDLGRRFRVRYGRIEVVFHDGRPSPRVTVEHRVLRDIDDEDSAERPPTPRRGNP